METSFEIKCPSALTDKMLFGEKCPENISHEEQFSGILKLFEEDKYDYGTY